MVGRQRKSRSASASVETETGASTGSKRSADSNEQDFKTVEPSRKKATLYEGDEEPGPEPTEQQVARLELEIQELGAENKRLKEQVEQLKMEQDGGETDTKQKPKKKSTAKSEPKKNKATKAQSNGNPAPARTRPKRKTRPKDKVT